ncbi:peptidoglycan editing factor PgeF [Agarilytica rhodophyticola]|uniref:peptidoglycan editing factor PgeF n=1 Tax=Agarilytica rhodophyticola TaxID=1737490 RepID=UPI000B348E0B|nr:peptidoglycan editing factor PgeF [Agarilytica rhodophyticola]
MNPEIMVPQWPIPANIRALITIRAGGVSEGQYDSFNLAAHVGDKPEHITRNRQQLYQVVGKKIQWLQQIHGTDVIELVKNEPNTEPIVADGVYSSVLGSVCAVLTADCLPILLCSNKGDWVAALHCGWRGLAAGIIERTLAKANVAADELMAYLGPAISQRNFEVGKDVFEAFQAAAQTRAFATPVSNFFAAAKEQNKFYADLYGLARSELAGLGVPAVYGGDSCTYNEAEKFYSYRRDGSCGRMASLIWIQE